MNLKNSILTAGVLAGLVLSAAPGCVKIDTNLGQDYMPMEQRYDVYTFEADLEEVYMKPMDCMSGYSTRRITFGAIDSEEFGLTRKSSAFTLIPAVDSIDFGSAPVVREFYISLKKDTTNTENSSQEKILQNVNVYSLRGTGIHIDSLVYINEMKNSDFASQPRISKGIPVYDGGDSLSFWFTKEYAQQTLDTFLANANEKNVYKFDSIPSYINKFPGIYICTDDPVGKGGRINMFDVAVNIEDQYVAGNYAELKITSRYNDVLKDTSFVFLFGAVGIPAGTTLPDQYAFNCTEIVGGKSEAKADDTIFIEGGNGVKPVVAGSELYELLTKEVDARLASGYTGVLPSDVVINKASIKMPFIFPANYLYMSAYPEILSPCCKIKGKTANGEATYTYASITDAGISVEKHGNIDRSNVCYASDISFHLQKLLSKDLADSLAGKSDAEIAEKMANYDLWYLINVNEVNESSSNSNSSYNDYLNQMYYYNYLNQLYGGYGGYGGYGYNNYYSMMMYSSLMNQSSSTTTSTSEELDRDRFYGAKLYGPTSGKGPKLTVAYAVPKQH